MELKDYIELVQKARIPTDEKALTEAFSEIIKAHQDYLDDKCPLDYAGDETFETVDTPRKYSDMMAYQRGIRMAKVYYTLAANPVYTVAMGDELYSAEKKMPVEGKLDTRPCRVFFVFATEWVAGLFAEAINKSAAEAVGCTLIPMKVVRVPMAAISESASAAYEEDMQDYDGSESGCPLPPVYMLVREKDKKTPWQMDAISGDFFDNSLPVYAVGSVNHDATDVLAGFGGRYSGLFSMSDEEAEEPDDETEEEL